MKISMYYEDKNNVTTIDVPDEECAIWVESDYQKRLESAEDKSKVDRRTPQQIMDEECNKPTFNSHQRETRRHVSLEAYDADHNLVADSFDLVEELLMKERYSDLHKAIETLCPQQKELLKKVFWEGIKQARVAESEGAGNSVISHRLERIYNRLKKIL